MCLWHRVNENKKTNRKKDKVSSTALPSFFGLYQNKSVNVHFASVESNNIVGKSRTGFRGKTDAVCVEIVHLICGKIAETQL